MFEFNCESWNANEPKPCKWLNGNLSNLNLFKLKTKTSLFLLKGLPDSAAPFLSFEEEDGYLYLESVEKGWNIEGFGNYIQFGSEVVGNPICIDLDDNDSIWLLNHDNDFEEIYINQNIEYFAQSLLAYNNFVRVVNEKYGDDAWYHGLYKESDTLDLKQSFQQIDKTILKVYNSYWRRAIDDLIAFMKP